MAPLLFSYGDDLVNRYKLEQEVSEYLASFTPAPSPAIAMEDESSLSINITVSNESSDVSLDQSNNGFSFVNIHWASFSTGLSSVLAIVLAGISIAGCCYLRGRRQRHSRARHTQLLHALSSSSRHVSSDSSPQSGKYPGSSGALSQDVHHPIVRYSAASSSASCGLPGCSTAYERLSLPALDRAVPSRYLPVSHEALPAISFIDRSPAVSAIDYKPSAPFQERRSKFGSRQTGINSFHG